MTTLSEIEQKTKLFSDAHGDLCSAVSDLNGKIEALKRAAIPAIKRAVERAAERKSALAALVESAPELFEKPRTVIFHGVKVGFKKQPGGLDWKDSGRVVELIRKHYTEEEAETLMHVVCNPDKTALSKLSAAELKKLGVEVTADSDAVLIKPAANDVEKIVNALLKEAEAGG